MSNWYDNLDKESEKSIRCFVSNSNTNPLCNEKTNGKLVIANIWSRSGDGEDAIYTEIRSGNHWRYAIPCEDAVPTFLNEYLYKDAGSEYSFKRFLNFIFSKNIDGDFYVQNLEEKYNKLIEKNTITIDEELCHLFADH